MKNILPLIGIFLIIEAILSIILLPTIPIGNVSRVIRILIGIYLIYKK